MCLEKSIIMCSTLSLRSFPNVAFETVPIVRWAFLILSRKGGRSSPRERWDSVCATVQLHRNKDMLWLWVLVTWNPNLPVTQPWCSTPPPLCCGCSKLACDTALVFHHPSVVVVPNLPVTQPWCSTTLMQWLFQTCLWHSLGVPSSFCCGCSKPTSDTALVFHHPAAVVVPIKTYLWHSLVVLLHHRYAVVVPNLPVTQLWCSTTLMLWLFQYKSTCDTALVFHSTTLMLWLLVSAT